ncbi:hypothetical protein [Zobellella iuensis]|uniref:DUF2909 domain-containing protein n=1 Tax=Zobellella iuensis TaxID=2803811 RepID=A0ABS1QU05_9GAMM|nr:hypothetical protein [Zobellella iuensis]MBL1378017.1 hypothetical protein [Zobellella iuensis]
MTTSLGLILIFTLFLAGGFMLLQGNKNGRATGYHKIIFYALAGVAIVFLAWLAIMVFVVGPSLRAS